MYNELLVCHGCLSTDRTLFPIEKLQDLQSNVDFLDWNPNNKGGVCWECKRIIFKLLTFKKQVKLAQNLLHVEKLQRLKCLSTLSCTVSSTHSYTVFDTIDSQSEEIKHEADNTNDISDNHFNDNQSIESDVYIEDYAVATQVKEIKEEVNDNSSFGKNCVEKNLYESDDCIEDNEIKTEIKTKEHILEKERKKVKKKTKKLPKVKSKRIKLNIDNKEDYDDIKDKFIEVEFTEDEMMKNRDEKRNHPNFKKLPYNCDTCVLGFTKKENYELHKEKKHSEIIGPLGCPVCQVRFTNNTTLTKHIKKHYHCYRCKLCVYETSELWSAISHSRSKHDGDSEDRIHCKKCSYVAKCREELAEHTRFQHSLICKECGEKFKGPNTLKTHKRRIHGTVREHKCEVCPRAFRSRGRLEAHAATHGPADAARLAYCAVCGVQYKNIYVYRNHLVNSANHSERRYHCEECGKKFASKVYYKRHYTFYHQKESNFKCELCDRLFISDWRLRHHRQMRHGAERMRNHACDQCGKKFYTASTLRAHQLTHSSARTFMCAHCGDTFKQRPALYTHTRLVHQGLKKHAKT